MKSAAKDIQPLKGKPGHSRHAWYASLLLILAVLCFGAGFTLGFCNRLGLTQFVSAGSFLAVWATVVGTARDGALPLHWLNKLPVTKHLVKSSDRRR
jgi:hypothetical protein